jgi:hypothetical protein
MVGAAGDDEPLDPELAARLRETFAAIVPKLDLPELARFQASIDMAALAPKFDMAALVQTFDMAALAPKFDVAALAPTLHDAIAAAAPKLDLRELTGFERVAEGLAERVSAKALAGLAASIELVVPAEALDDFGSLMGPDIIKWAAGLNLGDDLTGDVVEGEAKADIETDDARRERLRVHLVQTARWLYTAAVQIQAGVVRLNKTVDSLNENTPRYEKLAITLMKLYAAIVLLAHYL